MNSTRKVFNAFDQVISVPTRDMLSVGRDVCIPMFQKALISDFLDETLEKHREQKPLLELAGDFVIVGDIHGNLHDLLRIFATNGQPPETRYLFLGDYVDRGEFSFEVICLLLSLRNLFPDNVFLLRGNHEVREINEMYGFKTDIRYLFNDVELWEKFNSVFDLLPLAAIIDNTVFCVHGGLSPLFQSKSDIENITLPIKSMNKLERDLLWSDPSDSCYNFMRTNERGTGCLFGRCVTQKFLSTNNLMYLVRGHQCFKGGIDITHNGMCYTVFSSSDYETSRNTSGFLKLINKKLISETLQPLKKIRRSKSKFSSIMEEEEDMFSIIGILQYLLSFFIKPHAQSTIVNNQ